MEGVGWDRGEEGEQQEMERLMQKKEEKSLRKTQLVVFTPLTVFGVESNIYSHSNRSSLD